MEEINEASNRIIELLREWLDIFSDFFRVQPDYEIYLESLSEKKDEFVFHAEALRKGVDRVISICFERKPPPRLTDQFYLLFGNTTRFSLNLTAPKKKNTITYFFFATLQKPWANLFHLLVLENQQRPMPSALVDHFYDIVRREHDVEKDLSHALSELYLAFVEQESNPGELTRSHSQTHDMVTSYPFYDRSSLKESSPKQESPPSFFTGRRRSSKIIPNNGPSFVPITPSDTWRGTRRFIYQNPVRSVKLALYDFPRYSIKRAYHRFRGTRKNNQVAPDGFVAVGLSGGKRRRKRWHRPAKHKNH